MWRRDSRSPRRHGQGSAAGAQGSAAGAQGPAAGAPRGFTLIEVLVSVALLGLIFGLLYNSFFQISAGSTRLQNELTDQQELRLLLKLIVDDLQAAQYFENFVTSGGGKSGIEADLRFEGAGEFSRIRFHAALPARFFREVPPEQDPGTHSVAYWVAPSEENRERLVLMRREDFYLDDDMDEGGVSAELVEGIETFLVEFLPVEAREREDEEDWEDEWSSGERPVGKKLPLAIRVTLALKKQEGGRSVKDILEVNLAPTMGFKL